MPVRRIQDVIRGSTILTAPGDMSVREAARQMARMQVGSIMVVEDDNLIGIFTERDALVRVMAAGLDPDATPLVEVMTPEPQTIGADRPLGHALHLMYEGGFRHVPVVEGRRPVGMLSARDALGPELVAFEGELQRRSQIEAVL